MMRETQIFPPQIKKNPKYGSLEPLVLAQQQSRFPLNPNVFFFREAPLIVEIGFGLGDFLIGQALSHSQQNFLGIEYQWMPVYKTLKKIHKHRIENIRILFLDARFAFKVVFAPRSITKIYALFADPWFKKRHIQHRLFSKSFLKNMHRCLKINGQAEVVTDDQYYCDWIWGQLAGIDLHKKYSKIAPGFNTKYERKWIKAGVRKFHQILLEKEKDIAKETIREEAILKTYWLNEFDPERLSLQDIRQDLAVTFKEFLFDSKKKTGMIYAIAREGHCSQEFWITVKKAGQRWKIALSEGCLVLPTEGVHCSLEAVYRACLQTTP